jgi:hypothetical protein
MLIQHDSTNPQPELAGFEAPISGWFSIAPWLEMLHLIAQFQEKWYCASS